MADVTPRSWDLKQFTEAYERYRAYYHWMQDQVTGNPTQEEMLKQYTQVESEREELMVMHEVTRLINQYGSSLSKVQGVEVNDDGRVTLNMG